jgi:hypothetical protein
VQTALFFYVAIILLKRYPFLPLSADDCMRVFGYQLAVSLPSKRSCGQDYPTAKTYPPDPCLKNGNIQHFLL